MIEPTLAPKVYFDANPLIYFVEGDREIAITIKGLLDRLRSMPGSAVTSELTLAEVLAKPRLPDHRRTYLELIVWSGFFDLQAITRDLLIETASYRRVSAGTRRDGSASMVKLPDAIHVVTAIRSQCTHMLSDDMGLRLPLGMKRVDPDPSGIALLTQELV
jgi:predicted nucleic acid-binding protein